MKCQCALRSLFAWVMTLFLCVAPSFAASISGTVTSEATGLRLENIVVELYERIDGEWTFLQQTQTSLQGGYLHEDLANGTYLIRFRGAPYHVDEFFNNAPDSDTATPVVIADGLDQAGIDAALSATQGSISGTVTGADRVSPLSGIYVVLYYGYYGADGQWFSTNHIWTYTGADGSYRFDNLGEGVVYRVGFFDISNVYGTQYHENASSVQLGRDVTVLPGVETMNINAALLPFGVAWPEIVVEEPERTDLSDGVTLISFGDAGTGTAVTKTFVIRNIGTVDLTGLAVTIQGTDAGDFVASEPGAQSLAPGENTTFTITFTPSGEGLRSASLAIASNDVDENPFDMALEGNGLPPPVAEIVVEEPEGTELENGVSILAFGESVVGVPVLKTVTIRNTGTADLTDLAVTISGLDGSEFAVGAPGLATLAPGESTVFTVSFVPTGEGIRSADLAIVSNDADENPFMISLDGTGFVVRVPDMQLEYPVGTRLIHGSASIRFGNALVDSPVTNTITVRNAGEAALTGLAISIVGLNASDFSAGELGSYRLAPGATTSFPVTYRPRVGGYGIATLQIASNDESKNPFQIILSGTGIIPTAPEIVVEYPSGTSLVDGASHLAFGPILKGESVTRTVLVRNSGTAVLSGLAVVRGGMHASDFTLGPFGISTLAPGATTSFAVTFQPSDTGTRRASIHIASTDQDENPFDITLAGVGILPTSPHITVLQGRGTGRKLQNNRSKRDFGVVSIGSLSEEMVFTIRNDGTAPLRKVRLRIKGKQASAFEVVMQPDRLIEPGMITKCRVVYRPSRLKPSRAVLEIVSNDKDESPFRVKLAGKGRR